MGLRFLLLVGFTLLEWWLLIELGALWGAFTVLVIIVASALLGVRVLQLAGWRTWFDARQRLQRGESPAPELADGFLLAIAGFLLMLPGFISDAVGLVFLVGPLRRHLAGRVAARSGVTGRGPGEGPVTIEGEYRRES